MLCLNCSKVRFKIGVPVWPGNPKSLRVCSTGCAKQWRREAREDAKEEEQELDEIMRRIEAGEEVA